MFWINRYVYNFTQIIFSFQKKVENVLKLVFKICLMEMCTYGKLISSLQRLKNDEYNWDSNPFRFSQVKAANACTYFIYRFGGLTSHPPNLQPCQKGLPGC